MATTTAFPEREASPVPFLAGLAVLLAVLYRLYRYVLQDYQFFLSLGPGGIPSTPAGYVRTVLLRLIIRRDCLVPPPPSRRGRLYRPGPFFDPGAPAAKLLAAGARPAAAEFRPRTAGIAPHRQLPHKGDAADVARLSAALRGLAAQHPAVLRTGTSCFEKHNLALFVVPAGADAAAYFAPAAPGADAIALGKRAAARGGWNATCGAPPEMAHLHGSDGSLHMTLHPADAGAVLRAGWGERHPLAGRTLPEGYVMVYAPRGAAEVRLVLEVVRAAAWWVGSVRLGE